MADILFDESLPTLVRLLSEREGRDFVEAGVVLRDASGRLSFIAPGVPKADDRERLGGVIRESLGAYARPDRPIMFADDPGAQMLLKAPDRLPIRVDEIFCQVLDRRIVGAGWLNVPEHSRTSPPRVAFATLKGGVGRSTALVVTALDAARKNRNVLVIDLDLEAPGLGDLLLADDDVPDLGVLDFLVEDGLGGVKDNKLQSFVGSSELTAAAGGRVDVVPALGRRSILFPENILPKLARAMLEDVTETGSVSVTQQISTMVDRITAREQYDLVLIDSRAGLSELAAPAVLGLGATVLLFGTAQKQTVQGYKSLFAALQLLAQRDRAMGKDADWRTMFRPVYAKASLDPAVSDRFKDEMYELYSAHLYDSEEHDANVDALRFSRDDQSAPHWPLIVPFSQNFVDFDPSRIPSQLTQAFYEQTFRPFLDGIDAIVNRGSSIERPIQ